MTTVGQVNFLEKLPIIRAELVAIKVLTSEYESTFDNSNRRDDVLDKIRLEIEARLAKLAGL